MHDSRSQSGAFASVLFINVLNHFFAALMLEVDINVGRLVSSSGDESFKQQSSSNWIRFGDSEAVTDNRIGCGPSALAKDLTALGEVHDLMDREEVRRVLAF